MPTERPRAAPLAGIILLLGIVSLVGCQAGPTGVNRYPFRTESGPPQPRFGPGVFVTTGCGDCHAVAGVPSARGTLGPSLDGIASRAGERKPPLSAEAYIRESVERPSAFIVRGYFNAMPPDMRSRMTDAQYEDLVAWLMTLKTAPVHGHLLKEQ